MTVRTYPDGTLELDWTPDPPTVRVRLDGGPWMPVISDASVHAALDRIRDCKAASEALAILRPSRPPIDLPTIRSALVAMTADQRLAFFKAVTGDYCRHCGGDDPWCSCWDDD